MMPPQCAFMLLVDRAQHKLITAVYDRLTHRSLPDPALRVSVLDSSIELGFGVTRLYWFSIACSSSTRSVRRIRTVGRGEEQALITHHHFIFYQN